LYNSFSADISESEFTFVTVPGFFFITPFLTSRFSFDNSLLKLDSIVPTSSIPALYVDILFLNDPIFEPENCGRTFAEMTTEEKNRFSHRARAIKKMIDFLYRKT
jgi:hypothetical protein